MAQCFPPLEKLEYIRPPMTEGETVFLEALLRQLDNSYEVFVQPYLNGDRPDFVIMRRGSGVLIVEVKDWVLAHYENPGKGTKPWMLRSNGARIRSPLAQAQQYKKHLYELHIKELFDCNIADENTFSIVQPAVYFHGASGAEVRRFCDSPAHFHLLGRDELDERGIRALMANSRLNRPSRLFNDVLYNSFLRFLMPPRHEAEAGKTIHYSPRQAELIQSRENSRQKVRGVAGSGKTKVLAARAVNAHRRTGSPVLVLAYNLTLCNYIRDRISEVRQPFAWTAFQIGNYHQFINTQANNLNIEIDDLLQAADDPNLFAGREQDIERYGAILVDEVQDYETVWLSTLAQYFLEPGGELVVFGDEKQNVYGRELGEDRLPRIPTIPGRWNELKDSFRLDRAGMRLAQAFQRQYLSHRYALDEDAVPVQRDLLGASVQHRYRLALGAVGEALYRLVRSEAASLGGHPNDLVVLAPTFDTVRSVEYGFRTDAREQTTHAGETQEEYLDLCQRFEKGSEDFRREVNRIRRGRKLHFWANAGTSKFSSIHSFKGWEAPNLILILAELGGIERGGNLDELIYVALTRAQGNLLVIDTVGERYKTFFESAFRAQP